jgi:tRNA threonylcarbamoyladenosine biosynthesis protein TsaB
MRILALETSDRAGSIALADCDKLVAEQVLDSRHRSAQSLAPGVRSLLDSVGWRTQEIELIALTIGPGSFTGLRVGVVTAKTLAYAIGAQCIALNTLEVIAAQAPVRWPRLSVAMNAGRGELFHARFTSSMEAGSSALARWVVSHGPSILDREQWLNGLDPHTAITGPALVGSVDLLPQTVPIVNQTQWTPRAATVALLAWQRHLVGQHDDVLKLAPLYLRKSAAEEKLEQRGSTM